METADHEFKHNIGAFMKKYLLHLTLWGLGLFSSISQAAIQPTTFQLPGFANISSYELPNGLTIVVWPDAAAKQVGVNLWYRVGSLNEQPGITGIAHLFEHMMLRPSKYAPLGGLIFERTMGAEVGATTRFRTTNYHVTFAPEKLEEIIRYQADIMKNLPLNATMLSNEKEAVRSEYLNWDNTPFMVILPVLTKNAYPGHIAENFVIGERADLSKIKPEDCLSFYRKYYSPNNAVLVVTGKVDANSVISIAEKYFGAIPRGTPSVYAKDLTKLPAQKIVKQTVPGSSFPVAVTYSIPFANLPTKEDSALKLAFEIAFKGDTSLVGNRLVNQEKLADSVGYDDTGIGFYFVTLSLLGNNGTKAIQYLDESVEGIQKLDEAAFQRFASNSEADVLRALQTPAQRAKLLGYYLTHRNGVSALQADLTLSKSVTLAELKAVAAKYLNARNRIAVLGIPKGAK